MRYGPRVYAILIAVSAATSMLAAQGNTLPSDATSFRADADPSGYGLLEQIQRQACTARPRAFCAETPSGCLERTRAGWRRLFGEEPSEQTLAGVCARVTTRYEIPGVFNLLDRYYGNIRRAGTDIGIKVPSDVRIGTLAQKRVSAYAFSPDRGVQFVLLDLEFFAFANEMIKVVARSIPFKPGSGVIDAGIPAFNAALEKDPSIEALFTSRVKEFIDLRPPDSPFEPGPEIRPIMVHYTQGMETFAMAHELGHVVESHTAQAQAFDLQDALGSSLGLETSTASWSEEIEADIVGLKLARAVFGLEGSKPDAHIFARAGLPLSVEFYFVARQIILDARATFKKEPATPPPTAEDARLALVFDCLAKNDCGDLSRHVDNRFGKVAGHPSASVRQRLARWLLDLERIESEGDDLVRLAVMIRRNAVMLWERTRENEIAKR